MRWFQTGMTAAVALVAVSAAMAQNQNIRQGSQQPQQSPPASQGQFADQVQSGTNMSDMQIVTWLSGGNHGEVALGQMAEQHASNQQVKDLAREMVKQHSEFGQQLMRFAGQPATQTLTSSITGQPAAAGQTGMSGGLNFVAVIQQMDQQSQQTLSRDLGEKQGAEFDRCYVGEQIGAHMEMLIKLRVLRQYASPQLQQVLAQGEQTTQHHLDQFKQLMKTLESHRS